MIALQIKKTTYKITKVHTVGSTLHGAELVGPRGGIIWIHCFSNGSVRLVNMNRSGMPYQSVDLWDNEAESVRQTLNEARSGDRLVAHH